MRPCITSGSSRTLGDRSGGDLETLALFGGRLSPSCASVFLRLALATRFDAAEATYCGGLLFCDIAGDGSLLVTRDTGRALTLELVALASLAALMVF